MACEAAHGSPFTNSHFDDNWHKRSDAGLSAIADFNNHFDTIDSKTVDPQLTFSNPSTPTQHHFQPAFNTSIGPDQTLSPEPSVYEPYPPEFENQLHGSPYFQSIEAPAYLPSSLRNEAFNRHRRSVSEPPGGPPMQQQPPAMMFHREHHYLGKPIPQKPTTLKSLPKNRSARQHPYSRKARPAGPPPPPFRPEMRSTQTQPNRPAPTSTPGHMPTQYMPSPMMQEPQYVSSRVCTPVPEGNLVSPSNIDPALSRPATPCPVTPRQPASESKKEVTIPMTVEELRNMIVEAVQRAFAGRKEGVNSGVAIPEEQEAETAPANESMED